MRTPIAGNTKSGLQTKGLVEVVKQSDISPAETLK